MNALIVEDNAAMRHGYSVILRDSWGMQTQAVEGTAGAKAALAQTGGLPDLILADYHLGGSDTGLRTITTSGCSAITSSGSA